jgi:hypothetical protein
VQKGARPNNTLHLILARITERRKPPCSEQVSKMRCRRGAASKLRPAAPAPSVRFRATGKAEIIAIFAIGRGRLRLTRGKIKFHKCQRQGGCQYGDRRSYIRVTHGQVIRPLRIRQDVAPQKGRLHDSAQCLRGSCAAPTRQAHHASSEARMIKVELPLMKKA